MEPLQGWVIGWALAEVLVPLAVGAALGRGWRAATTPSGRTLGLVWLLVAGAWTAADVAGGWVGLWDAVLVAVLAGCGAAVGAGLVRRGPLGGYLAGSAVALLLAEAAVRLLIPPWTGLPTPDLPPIAVIGDGHPDLPEGVRTWTEVACRWIYLDAAGVASELTRRRTSTDEGPGVLHVGDSVVAGLGSPLERTFVALMDKADPDRWHVQVGVPGTSVDVSLSVARAWMKAQPWDEVVHYVLLVNDPDELELALPCCDDGPALDENLQPRCPQPRPVGRLRWAVGRSRPPFPLAVAAHGSALVAQVYKAWWMLTLEGQHLLWPDPALSSDDARVDRIVAIETAFVAEARALGTTPSVVVLPVHPRLVASSDGDMDARHARLVGGLTAAQVPFVDAYDWSLKLASAGVDLEPLYSGDVHFSDAGQIRFADWLLPRLEALRAER